MCNRRRLRNFDCFDLALNHAGVKYRHHDSEWNNGR
jgi:hypothetical protein